jgi:hypothetical protein
MRLHFASNFFSFSDLKIAHIGLEVAQMDFWKLTEFGMKKMIKWHELSTEKQHHSSRHQAGK